jgi:hypothetical protein
MVDIIYISGVIFSVYIVKYLFTIDTSETNRWHLYI